MKLLELVANLATRWRHLHWLPILPPDAPLAYWFQIWPPDGANCISCKFAHQMAPLALVPYLTTRWHHLHWLQTWPPDGTTWISYKFGHQMSPLVLVPNLTTRWLFTNLTTRWHHLHQFQIWSPDGATCINSKHLHFFQIWPPDSSTCISFKFCHQMALLWLEIWPPGWLDESHALPHCLGLPYWHYQLVLAWYLHQAESHQLSLQQGNLLSEREPDP